MNWSTKLHQSLTRQRLSPQRQVPLCKYTSFGIGGPATLLVEVTTASEAKVAIDCARAVNGPVLILGGGTNLLVSDTGFDGLVIKVKFNQLKIDGSTVTVGTSVLASHLVDRTVQCALAGLEFAAGLPGTVGGAVAGNAGCFGSSFGEQLSRVTLVDLDGQVVTRPATQLGFQYRNSAIKESARILVDATFELTPGDPVTLTRIANEHKALRRNKHPAPTAKTAGSYFKNLPPSAPGERRRAAGTLLDKVGARNERVGDAAVFEKHANILVNLKNATARDVLTLENRLKKRVLDQFGVLLEPEVRFVGERPTGL